MSCRGPPRSSLICRGGSEFQGRGRRRYCECVIKKPTGGSRVKLVNSYVTPRKIHHRRCGHIRNAKIFKNEIAARAFKRSNLECANGRITARHRVRLTARHGKCRHNAQNEWLGCHGRPSRWHSAIAVDPIRLPCAKGHPQSPTLRAYTTPRDKRIKRRVHGPGPGPPYASFAAPPLLYIRLGAEKRAVSGGGKMTAKT